MRTVDHQFQLDRINQDGLSIACQYRLVEWLHWIGNIVLFIASILWILSLIELFREPGLLGAFGSIGEILAIQFDLVLHLIGYHLKLEVDNREVRLKYELQVKDDELRQLATAFGLDLGQYPVP